MRKKYGKIKVVASTGGIKLEGEDFWLNPNENVKKFITKDLIGKNVELTLDDNNKITYLEKLPTEKEILEVNEEDLSKPETKNEYREANNRRIVRQNVLSHATNIAIAIYNRKEEVDGVTVDEVTDTIMRIAERLENWVYRG